MKKICFILLLVFCFSFAEWMNYREANCWEIQEEIKANIENNDFDAYIYNCDEYRAAIINKPLGCDYNFYQQACTQAEAEEKEDCENIMQGLVEESAYCNANKDNPDDFRCTGGWTMLISYCSQGFTCGRQYYTDFEKTCELCKNFLTTDGCKWGIPGEWPPVSNHCSNYVQDEDEEGRDCGGEDCDPCSDITFNPPSGQIMADGETNQLIRLTVMREGEPAPYKTLTLTLSQTGGSWSGDIGQLKEESVSTGADGTALIEYQPPLITTNQVIDDIEITITATSSEGTSGSGVYQLVPDDMIIAIEEMVAVQTLKSSSSEKIPMIAGKKLVLFVVVNSTKPEAFSPQEDRQYTLDIIAEAYENGEMGDDFTPNSVFVYTLDEQIADPDVDMFEGQAADEYLSFLGVEKAVGSIYRVYIFYLDHPKTDLHGYYEFDAKLSMIKENEYGELEESVISRRRYTSDVFPSKPFHLTIVPVGIGVWHPDLCEFCVEKKMLGYEFECTKQEVMGYTAHEIFDHAWKGKISNTAINRALTGSSPNDPTLFRSVCADGFRTEFTQAERNQLTSQTPATYGDYVGTNAQLTPEQRYQQLAADSVSYFKAVMPLAEEDITVNIVSEPVPLPTSTANIKYPFSVLIALQDQYDLFLYKSRYRRVVGIVPVDGARELFGKAYSDLQFDEEGYSNGLISDEVILLSHQYSGPNTMTHEIAHTYCAIDEYESWFMRFLQAGIKVPLSCGYGEGPWINSRRGDDKGTPVTNGFWVSKRKVMGTQDNPKYSFMGSASDNQQWITEELYYGIGRNLHIFPLPTSTYTPNHPYYLK